MTEQTMSHEEREKLLSKVKKCLALSKSPEPHEAAAAMRQAQKMMEKLGVTAEEVEAPDMAEVVIKTREGYGNCRYMNHLAGMIQEAFGVRPVYSRNPGTADRLNVRYFGPKARVTLAEYAHRVVQRALEEAWASYLERRPWKKGRGGVRQSFYIGWLWAVKRQVSALGPTEAEERAVDLYIERKLGALSTFDKRKQKELDVMAARQGQLAAAEFSINVPLQQEQLKIGRG